MMMSLTQRLYRLCENHTALKIKILCDLVILGTMRCDLEWVLYCGFTGSHGGDLYGEPMSDVNTVVNTLLAVANKAGQVWRIG